MNLIYHKDKDGKWKWMKVGKDLKVVVFNGIPYYILIEKE